MHSYNHVFVLQVSSKTTLDYVRNLSFNPQSVQLDSTQKLDKDAWDVLRDVHPVRVLKNVTHVPQLAILWLVEDVSLPVEIQS